MSRIAALKQVAAGRAVEDVAREVCYPYDVCVEGEVRRHGCKPGAGDEAVARRERTTGKLVADLSLDKEALQSVIRKNGWSA